MRSAGIRWPALVVGARTAAAILLGGGSGRRLSRGPAGSEHERDAEQIPRRGDRSGVLQRRAGGRYFAAERIQPEVWVSAEERVVALEKLEPVERVLESEMGG